MLGDETPYSLYLQDALISNTILQTGHLWNGKSTEKRLGSERFNMEVNSFKKPVLPQHSTKPHS